MSSADPRYQQLWAAKGGGASTAKPKASKSTSAQAPASSTASYRIDLDAPGGVTYAPASETANHSAKRRLFIPRRGAQSDEYDFGHDIAQRLKAKREKEAASKAEERKARGVTSSSSSGVAPFAIGDDDEDVENGDDGAAEDMMKALGISEDRSQRLSAAQVYARSIDMTPRTAQQAAFATATHMASVNEDDDGDVDVRYLDQPRSIAPSDTRSVRSTVTASDLARKQGLFQNAEALQRGGANFASFKPPPSISGDTARSKNPWKVESMTTRREFEQITEEEKELGLLRYDEQAGEGNVPSREEVENAALRDASSSDAATIKTSKTLRGSNAPLDPASLRISDLFIPDPRPYRPLRLVRRTDPRQVLLLCSSVCLTARQLATSKAARQAASQSDDFQNEQAKKLLAEFASDDGNPELRAGLGMYYCPPDPLHSSSSASNSGDSLDLASDLPSLRTDPNFSKRMERCTFPHRTSPHRAALRSVLAALEYIRWESEGFNQLVLGFESPESDWLIQSLAYDVHEWRANQWVQIRNSTVLGSVGDSVPDRDLFEAVDAVIRQYEANDISVRFWAITPPTSSSSSSASLRRPTATSTATGSSSSSISNPSQRSNNNNNNNNRRDDQDVFYWDQVRNLAESGALKEDQMPAMVRWTRRAREEL